MSNGERLIAKSEKREGAPAADLYEPVGQNLEVYADGIHGLVIHGATVKINWFTRRFDSDPELERRDVVSRTVMSADTFFAVADFLKKNAEKLKAELAKAKEQQAQSQEK